MDSETYFSSDSDYDEFANKIQFVGDILQSFQFEPVFTDTRQNVLAGTNVTELDAQPAH